MKTNTTANIRSEPSTTSNIIITIPQDVTLQQLDRPWVQIRIGDVTGWIALELTADHIIGLPTAEPDERIYTLSELLPLATQIEFPSLILLAIARQESGFKNWRVHHDQTGHGLFGLDDNGLLPEYEAFTNTSVGRGPSAQIMPIELQIAYAKHKLQQLSTQFGGPYNAARVWHRGAGQWQDSLADNYEALIRQHEQDIIRELA